MSNDTGVMPAGQEADDWRSHVAPLLFSSGLTDREKSVVLVLEYRARSNPYTFMSLRSVARLASKSLRATQTILSSLQRKGWIQVIHRRGPKSAYCGIVMRRRVNVDLPRATTQAEIDDIAYFLRGPRILSFSGERATKSAHYKKTKANGYSNTHTKAAAALESESQSSAASLVYPLLAKDEHVAPFAAELASRLERIADPRVSRAEKARQINAGADLLSELLIDETTNKRCFAWLLWMIPDHERDAQAVLDVLSEVYAENAAGNVRTSPAAMFVGRLKGRWEAMDLDKALEED